MVGVIVFVGVVVVLLDELYTVFGVVVVVEC